MVNNSYARDTLIIGVNVRCHACSVFLTNQNSSVASLAGHNRVRMAGLPAIRSNGKQHMTKSRDRRLGMNRPVTRRDILHGLGVLAGASFTPGLVLADAVLAAETGLPPGYYPPALTGMRGNHPGSFDAAHPLAREGRQDWGEPLAGDEDSYDLIVVGGGISGLAAAHFYLEANPRARVLILDNHDDFGGHAKRNEFRVGNRTLIGYGGSQSMEDPSHYSEITHKLLRDLGIDLKRFESAYDWSFLQSHGLTGGVYFGAEQWGTEKLVPFDLGTFASYLPIAKAKLSAEEAVAQMPISSAAQKQLLVLLTETSNRMPGMSVDARWDWLLTHSYRDYISQYLGVTEPDVFKLLQDLALDQGVGIELASAETAMDYSGLPGRNAAALPRDNWVADDYVHHFPDGNAGIARLLVRNMIPSAAPGDDMEDIVLARFDYSKLDQAGAPVRLRLNSTAVHVEQEGGPNGAGPVMVDYMRAGKAHRVRSRACVLACYHSIIPYLCPQLPEDQRSALARQVKSPILYTSVALRNWRAWKALGLGAVSMPGGYHTMAILDFPVSLGGYEFAKSPDDPIIVHMEKFLHRNNEGLSRDEQHRLGRHELLATPFETIERSVRGQLAGVLGDAGFDPVRDIEGITVNRWAHGYARGYNPVYDTIYENRDDERAPHMRARKSFGRITIANSDADARAWMPAAVEQAYRAVSELA